MQIKQVNNTTTKPITNTNKPMTIAQQLKIKDFPFIIKDNKGNEIYCETSDGHWRKREYDDNGNKIYCEDANGHWWKYVYNDKGNEIYCETSDGHWR